MAVEDTSALIGSVSDGRYRIEALLGEGAVGSVYRALDIESNNRVALKQWNPVVLSDEMRRRFEREAMALATLDHPNIVKVIGHGFVDGVPYVALEYLEGRTLETLVTADTPLALDLALDLAQQALSAIAYAHAHEVVHRDLKPENIFVTRDDRGRPLVKILDYGLAKFMSNESVHGTGSAPLTALGVTIGTPLYMPPEQAAGSSVDLAADVYSFGCVLFEMLAGQPPFLADTNLELIHAHLHAPIPKLADALPGKQVAPELQALIDRALAKKQTERFPNAGAMLEALNRLPEAPITDAPVKVERAAKPVPAAPAAPASRPRPARAEPEPASTALAKGSATRVWGAVALLVVIAIAVARACA